MSKSLSSSEFVAFHQGALEADEIRHNILLSILDRLRLQPKDSGIKTWTFGAPGACAAQSPGYPVVLGNLSREQCQAFADAVVGTDYPGVMGADDTALWFAERARQLGDAFPHEVPQQIKALFKTCLVPSVPGFPRRPSPKDFALFKSWTQAFIKEAVPFDPVPPDDALMASLRSRSHWFWMLEGKYVSMAALARRTKRTAFINSVYTPVVFRNNGFASAITAIVARDIFEEGRRAACLYVDLRNAAANRCYEKLGFVPYCKTWLLRH